MASFSARLSLGIEQGYGEQEKDANSQLLELDKGLRSSKSEEQCEAIVRFPRLFEKFPFPILINSAFLKLADVFRVGTNFQRLCILKVSQQSSKHLDKIINVEQFLRKIFSVIHSNDPVARAITLRTLGSCASILAERKNVHHSIVTALDSHDSVELEAAIAAAHHFAARSKEFASSICGKLASMIEGLATPVEMKLKLLALFEHMHHDAAMSAKVRELCSRLLPAYPAQSFVLVTLHTLSLLATHALVGLGQQVKLLLTYLRTDPRKSVKSLTLRDLRLLAEKGPHMWTQEDIESLSQFVRQTPYAGLKVGGLIVLSELATTSAITAFLPTKESEAYQLACECSLHDSLEVAVRACSLQTYLSMHWDKGGAGSSCSCTDQAAIAMETLIVTLATEDSPRSQKALKRCLHLVVCLCHDCPQMTDRFVDLLVSMLPAVSDRCALLLCECLAALSSKSNELLQSLAPDIMAAIEQVSRSPGPHKEKLLVSIITLLFQAFISEVLDESVVSCIQTVLDDLDPWMAYRLGRCAARYGHHNMAAVVFGSLTTKVSTEHFYFWLSALQDCSLGERHLCDLGSGISDFHERLSRAQTCYQKALAALKAATMPCASLSFPLEYLRLRCQMLQVLVQLMKACTSFHTGPPPAIATSLALTTGKEIHRYGHVVAQLQRCGVQFEQLAAAYRHLYQTSFDADPATLTSLKLLEHACKVLLYALDTVLGSFSRPKQDTAPTASFLTSEGYLLIEHQPWQAAFEKTIEMVNEVKGLANEVPLTHHHMSCVQRVVLTMTQVPLCLPRYLFQNLQATSIKLAISPQPRNASDPVTIHYDTHLTLKVEGVIQHGLQAGLFRKVHAVSVSVSSVQQIRTQMVSEVKVKENPPNMMTQTAQPHNDYFSVQFLLAFPITGVHSVTIDTAVVDEDGVLWHTGPQSTLSVKSYDEAVQRAQQQQYAAQRQQQRAAAHNLMNLPS